MIGEAGRARGNAPHVKNPREPRLVYGIELSEVGQRATHLSYEARDRAGRRLRSDGVALVAGVVSYPIQIRHMGGFTSDFDVYQHWVALTLQWLQKEHGPCLKSVVEHDDEDQFHLHFYVLPELGADGRSKFDRAHPGRSALDAATERGVGSGARRAAYTNAMVEWQDRFHASVGKLFGHERLGPRRMRIERARHKVNREAEERLARIRAELELEYWAPTSEEAANDRARHISKTAFIAAAVERQRHLLAEIEHLKALLRKLSTEHHAVSSAPVPEPPLDRHAYGETLNLLAELDVRETAEANIGYPVNHSWSDRATMDPKVERHSFHEGDNTDREPDGPPRSPSF